MQRIRFPLIVLLFLILVIPSASSQSEKTNDENPELPGMPDLFSAALRVILSLLLILGLLVGGTLLVKRFAGRGGITAGGSPIRVIWQQSIGPRRSISIVRILDKTVVLGVTNTCISHIMTLDQESGGVLDDLIDKNIGAAGIMSIIQRFSHVGRKDES